MRTNRSWPAVVLTASAATLSPLAGAQDAKTPAPDKVPSERADKPAVLDSVVVTGASNKLDRAAPTASRLGISARDTPAAIDSIDAKAIEARGYKTVAEAVDSLPGVTSGGAPGSPSQFSMRGFTADQITILRDGLYIGPANMTYRPQNSFNLSGIDVLKGPGSVLYGQGAVAGTVNVITKTPVLGSTSFSGVASYGRYNSTQLGLGGNVSLNAETALRIDASRTSSDGFVNGAKSDTSNLTTSVLWQPSDRFDLQASLDVMHDNPPPYWGTPLVPASSTNTPLSGVVSSATGLTIDERMRFVNYNVADYQITATQYMPRVTLRWNPVDDVTVTNDTYYFYADRKWKNAESYSFNPATNLVDRDRFFVFHTQKLWGNQLSAAFSKPVGGLTNRFVVGLDYSKLDFKRTRGFPDGDSVDPFNPVPGSFGALAPPGQVERVSPTKWQVAALFAEDALDITPALKLVTGLRYESFKLDRKNFGPDGSFQAASSFERTWHPINGRVGVIYQATPDISPYVQYSTGQDPVGSNILLVNAGENFDLSRSSQIEAGVKASFDNKRGNVTMAIYSIKRKNVLMQTSPDTVVSADQKSKGIELAADYKPTRFWQINGNVAYTDARYGMFFYNGNDVSGNRPANIPKWTANLSSSVSGVGGLPLELGAGVRYVADRYGDNANTLTLNKYTLLDLHGTYAVTPTLRITGRVNNALNKAYAQWADVNYPTQVQLGSPVSYEISLAAKF
jgi:iron complex outermembrane receptor protein